LTTPNVLVLARLLEHPEDERRILELLAPCPHIILENKGKVELDVLKDYASHIRMHIFEAADRSFFRRHHSESKKIRIMRDLVLFECEQEQSELVIANFLEYTDAGSSSHEEYNHAILDMCSDIYNASIGSGSLVVFYLVISGKYHLFFGGASLSLSAGTLFDVIPTLLDLMGIAKPDEMKGTSIII